ncbi:hypothetical protein [Hymenobacter telluris]|uniref:hypothetical protein n=1 Tax=Hymenobacter telluris TaxID=2816474 RepID=UPI001A8C1F81|nr:hypothetical protein [Hymenobacter telluris]
MLTVSPIVGPVIDQKEKATYGLFPYYSADNFVEARFEQHLSPDSTIQLRALLRDGRTVERTFTPAAFATVRTTIEARQQELAGLPPPPAPKTRMPPFLTSRWLRAELRSGVIVEGELLARYRTQLELLPLDSGLVVVERADIVRLEPAPRPQHRATTHFDVGNGHRLFLLPTARNLRRGEGYFQQTDGGLYGASYGFTNNFSVGVLVSVLPFLPLRNQVLLVTPKLSTKLSEKWHVGGGVLYTRLPKLDPEFKPVRTGIGYGIVTYGSADNNVSVGLGYAINKTGIDKTPVLHYGGQRRISRGWSVVSENFLLINDEPGTLGLFGARHAGRRFSLGLGGIYLLPFTNFKEDAFVGFPIYVDVVYRFGKGSR